MEKKFKNFQKALKSLTEALVEPISDNRDISGIIKSFEFVYELSWNTLKAQLALEGHASSGARNVFQVAYQLSIINNEQVFLEMISDRNLAVHTYNYELASEMLKRIQEKYYPEFLLLDKVFSTYLGK